MSSGTPAGRCWDRPLRSAPAVVGGRYEIGTLIGCGGTACVYRAHDTVFGREVAVKLFHPELVGTDEDRFDREVRILGRLRHPGVITPYDAGMHEGQAFLAMELVEGHTLGQRLAGGPLPVAATLDLGRCLAQAMAHVHAAGVTHRDLKPGNVLLGRSGPLITDFGIAKVTDSACCTATGVIVGTASYMAPEQVRGEMVGPAADVFALGLVLLECVTGRREYSGGALEAAVARLHRPPAIPDDLPFGLTGMLRRMTAADPRARPTARDVASALGAVAGGVPVHGDQRHVLREGLAATTLPLPRARPVRYLPTRVSRRRRTARALIASTAVALTSCLLALASPATLDARDTAKRMPPQLASATGKSTGDSAGSDTMDSGRDSIAPTPMTSRDVPQRYAWERPAPSSAAVDSPATSAPPPQPTVEPSISDAPEMVPLPSTGTAARESGTPPER